MLTKKDQLIKKATELFAQNGFHAVGIDRILAESGISKMTLYKYFPSKTDLIAEVLNERDKSFRESLTNFVEQHETFLEKIHAVFVWHDKWFKRKNFNGCLFINASAEYHDKRDEIHKLAAQHKELIISYLETIYLEFMPESAKDLALQTNLLLDGAIVAAHVTGNLNAAWDAWAATCRLAKINF